MVRELRKGNRVYGDLLCEGSLPIGPKGDSKDRLGKWSSLDKEDRATLGGASTMSSQWNQSTNRWGVITHRTENILSNDGWEEIRARPKRRLSTGGRRVLTWNIQKMLKNDYFEEVGAEPREDRSKIDEWCLTTVSRGDGVFLGEEFSPTQRFGTFLRLSIMSLYQWSQVWW